MHKCIRKNEVKSSLPDEEEVYWSSSSDSNSSTETVIWTPSLKKKKDVDKSSDDDCKETDNLSDREKDFNDSFESKANDEEISDLSDTEEDVSDSSTSSVSDEATADSFSINKDVNESFKSNASDEATADLCSTDKDVNESSKSDVSDETTADLSSTDKDVNESFKSDASDVATIDLPEERAASNSNEADEQTSAPETTSSRFSKWRFDDKLLDQDLEKLEKGEFSLVNKYEKLHHRAERNDKLCAELYYDDSGNLVYAFAGLSDDESSDSEPETDKQAFIPYLVRPPTLPILYRYLPENRIISEFCKAMLDPDDSRYYESNDDEQVLDEVNRRYSDLSESELNNLVDMTEKDPYSLTQLSLTLNEFGLLEATPR